MYILGDLNCDLIKDNLNQPSKTLKGILELYQLSQLITEATRITKNSTTLIDHFITSSLEKINMSGVIHTGISDHSLIYGIWKINPVSNTRMKEIKIEIRNIIRFNQERFNEELLRQLWENIVLQSNTDCMWALWKELFLEILDKHAHHLRKRSSPIPLLNAEIHDRDRNKRKAMITNLCADWDNYKNCRNRVNVALRNTKSNYYCTKTAILKEIIPKKLGKQLTIYWVGLPLIQL